MLPGAGDLLPRARWPRALLLIPDKPGNSKLFAWGRLSATVVGFDELTDDGVRQQLARYPTATDAQSEAPPGIPLLSAATTAGPGARLYWPTASPDVRGQQQALDRSAPADALTGAHWLRPDVGASALSDLMSWWLVLFALSMLARYEPDRWTTALDYDTSELAAALGACSTSDSRRCQRSCWRRWRRAPRADAGHKGGIAAA